MLSSKPWQPYPEDLLETPLGGLHVEVFIPDRHQVVMGAGGKAEQEVFLPALERLKIPLYKRKGGGGTVLLGPETIVVTLHAGVAHPFKNLAYFRAINSALMAVFSMWQKEDYRQRGISDIALGDRKIVGTSIFRRKQYLLFQASILVDLNLTLMNQVLRPPPRQPDYRKDREHSQFLTSLRQIGISRTNETLVADLLQWLPVYVPREIRRVDHGAAPS